MGTTEIVIFALTVGVSIWSWLVCVVRGPQDFATFSVLFLGANLVGAALQMIFYLFVRPRGSLIARLTLTTTDVTHVGSSVVLWMPTVLYAVVFLIVTPPGTSGVGFDPDMNIYQVMGLMLLLGLVATLIGSVLLYCIVVVPLAMLMRGILPEARDAANRPYAGMSRTQYVCMALIILAVVVFSVSMVWVAPDAPSPSSYGRMGQEFIALVTLSGVLGPSIVAVASAILIVVLGIINNRAAARVGARGRDHASSREPRR